MNARNGKLVFLPRSQNSFELRRANAVADLDGVKSKAQDFLNHRATIVVFPGIPACGE
jgi:hypothetical protein